MRKKARQYKWGKLTLRTNMEQASSPILYQYEEYGPNEWLGSPFQAADARHNWDDAFRLINNWITSKYTAFNAKEFR
jgi:hypothetical protein